MSTSYLLFIPAALLFGSTASYTIDKVESANFLFPVAIYAAMIPYLVVSIVDMIGVSANQGMPFGDCLLLSALLHRAGSAAGHTVEQ